MFGGRHTATYSITPYFRIIQCLKKLLEIQASNSLARTRLSNGSRLGNGLLFHVEELCMVR